MFSVDSKGLATGSGVAWVGPGETLEGASTDSTLGATVIGAAFSAESIGANVVSTAARDGIDAPDTEADIGEPAAEGVMGSPRAGLPGPVAAVATG